MGDVFAEASPCCFSPQFGRLMIAAYIVGGVLVYLWLFYVTLRWVQARHRRPGPAPEPNRR